jgi:hypothetical protein
MSTASSDTLNNLDIPELVFLFGFDSRKCIQQLSGEPQSTIAAIEACSRIFFELLYHRKADLSKEGGNGRLGVMRWMEE